MTSAKGFLRSESYLNSVLFKQEEGGRSSTKGLTSTSDHLWKVYKPHSCWKVLFLNGPTENLY